VKGPLPQTPGGRVLADWVTDTIREAIFQGYFEPGEKIDQERIGEELNVSRTPIRESLKALESEGLIKIRPHRGAFVTRVTREDITNVYEVRRLLEPAAVRQVTPLIPDSVLDELESSLAEARALCDAGDTSVFSPNDIHFHNTILCLVENKLLNDILDGLHNRISIIRRYASLRPGSHMIESMQEHRDIIQAMRRRDSEQAAEAMRLHIENTIMRVVDLVPLDD
jgi:DNA-binding GntR family transcriptional regulator